MEGFQVSYRLQRGIGFILLVLGLIGDCGIGWLLLARTELQLSLLHFPFALMWALGVSLVTCQRSQQESTICMWMNRWGMTALLLGFGTFPGFGSCMYSIALIIIRYLSPRATVENSGVVEPAPQEQYSAVEMSPSLDWVVQPLVDDLRALDTEFKRATVAKLGRYANPETTQLLRQLLSDPHAEIRSDASIVLARLEDELSCTLNTSFEQWTTNPTDIKYVLTLVDCYYQYARSNVLDRISQRFYLVMARDLLLQVIALENTKDARLWLTLARIRQSLGEISEALQDARYALQLQPDLSEASLLTMELAFHAHAWDTLVSLADEVAQVMPGRTQVPASLMSLQGWTTLHPQLYGGA